MKRLTILLLTLLCTACTALPQEERAFAVALCVERPSEWRVHARIPTYQNGGGYRTLSGTGDTLDAALTDLSAAAPMHLTLSQLRLLVLSADLADSADFADALAVLSARADLRMQCTAVLTEDTGRRISDALKPTAGTRLSKSIDVLLETHAEQGDFLPVTLAELLCMGERQSPVLMCAALSGDALTFSGGYALTAAMRRGLRLDEADIRLMALLRGHTREMPLTVSGLHTRVRDIRVRRSVDVSSDAARVTLSLRLTTPSADDTLLAQSLSDACAALLTRLSAAGCDVLGLGRKAILHAEDMSDWHALDWLHHLRRLNWSVTVNARPPV